MSSRCPAKEQLGSDAPVEHVDHRPSCRAGGSKLREGVARVEERAGGLERSRGALAEGVAACTAGGLVKPSSHRSSGYRDYNSDAVRRVRFIRRAQALGFTLEEIAGLLRLRITPGMDCAPVRARTAAKLADVEERLVELERIRDALAKLVSACPARGPVIHCTILDTLDSDAGEDTPSPMRRFGRHKIGDNNMKLLELRIEGMHCDGCASTIEALLAREPGVKSVSVSHAAGQGRVLYDPALTDTA
ncbi:MAG: MerR family DNA-binding protein, partial [Beggiatoa sp.]|nr:MerR family DNA-binding protein [Beggiatoa sp.]